MRKKNYKGRCEKQSLEKFTTICKTYDPIQSAYANILVKNKDVAEVRCNVPLDGDECGEYMTDFVCKKTDPHKRLATHDLARADPSAAV